MNWILFVAVTAWTVFTARAQILTLESNLTFNMDGINHHETRKVEGDTVTLTDEVDGFIVTLDYDRGIFMIKNVTSQTCFFSQLENIPVTKDQEIPIFVQEVTENSVLEHRGQNADVLQFKPVAKLPFSYVLLTNEKKVSQKCISQSSYWLETKSISRQRRDDCDTLCTVGLVVVAVVIGISIG